MGLSYEKRANRGVITTEDSSVTIKFQYNPTEITDAKAVNYQSKTPRGKYRPTYQFVNGGERSLKFKLLIDSLHSSLSPDPDKDASYKDSGDPKNIEKILDNFRKLVYPKETDWTANGPKPKPLSSGQKFTAPPRCRLSLGNKVIRGFVKTLSIKESLYNANLEPVRAELQLVFVEE